MPLPASQVSPGSQTRRAPADRTASSHLSPYPNNRRSSRSAVITDRLVASTLTWTMLDLEERLIPSQGAGDILYVYAGDTVVTHDIRRTLKVFEGDVEEAIENIRAFVTEGILGAPGASC